ncbi:MAG TPA: cysteine--tRNA ligase [Candidatus Saccharimonadales bacterium]|nr:cysteine--tRNA ligase [Candidatus Saccharimonadales bacterium]
MLHLFNTLSQNKEEFKPLHGKNVTLYVCGITPYDTTHLGHAFTYLSFDVLIKYLTYKGYNVTYTQNVTDINDRDNDILKRAKDEGTTWEKLAEFWTNKFLFDMESLNWTKPTHYLWASEQIPSMISLIQKIVKNGYGYEVNGSVYLDVKKYPGYGVLSKLTEEEMLKRAAEFEEDLTNPDKKNPLDITLWRATQPDQSQHIPSFESVFGPGRPGWHIECSAMSTATLGDQIDIHGGGIDLIYPHHESEITQSETGTGKIPFAQYWMHSALVQKDHEKMSKSKGNLVLVSDLLKKYSPNALRWYLLSHHYRESWNFEEAKLQEAEELTKKLKKLSFWKATTLPESNTRETDPGQARMTTNNDLLSEFEKLMDDDLNTPEVLHVIEEKLHKDSITEEEKESLTHISQTLGFIL